MQQGIFKRLNAAVIVFSVALLVFILYGITYFFPVTDNAFIVSNRTPVSALVNGYITTIYVHNGQFVKKGDPLIKVYQKPYKIALLAAKAEYAQAKAGLLVLKKTIEMTRLASLAANDQLDRMRYEYKKKSAKKVRAGVPELEIKSMEYNIKSQKNTVKSLKKQIELEQATYAQTQQGINAIKAHLDEARLNLKNTIVYAKTDGYVQEMYASVGTPVRATGDLFLFVDTSKTYVQANMLETDLADVRKGDRVSIYPRTYLGHKVFHGTVMSDYWSVNRQYILPLPMSQTVLNENKWLLLPQRFPVQIRVDDVDAAYPLRAGMSTYVYIHTR